MSHGLIIRAEAKHCAIAAVLVLLRFCCCASAAALLLLPGTLGECGLQRGLPPAALASLLGRAALLAAATPGNGFTAAGAAIAGLAAAGC